MGRPRGGLAIFSPRWCYQPGLKIYFFSRYCLLHACKLSIFHAYIHICPTTYIYIYAYYLYIMYRYICIYTYMYACNRSIYIHTHTPPKHPHPAVLQETSSPPSASTAPADLKGTESDDHPLRRRCDAAWWRSQTGRR